MWFVYILVFCLLFLGVFAIGELVAQNSTNSIFTKWWRKNVIEECQDCD